VEGGTVVKKARALILSLILATTLLAGVSAFDWGGTLDNSTTVDYTFTDPDASLSQKDTLALWLETGISPSLVFTLQGSFTYTYESPKPEYPYLPDVDLLNLHGTVSLERERISLIRYTIGRFVLNDFTGLVLADGIDGFKVDWSSRVANASLAVGYSGLHFDQNSTINISWADFNNTELLAPPRLIGELSVEFPELFLRQDLHTVFLMQQDFRPENELLSEGPGLELTGKGGRLSTQYLGAGLNGGLIPSLYYEIFAYLGTGKSLSYIDGEYQYEWILSTLLGASLRYFREELLHTRAELRLLFASGDEDFSNSVIEANREGLATMFVPISTRDLALVFSPRLANLIFLEASYSIKPLPELQTQIKGIVFLRPTTGPVSDTRVTDDSVYLGSEIDTVATFRPFSDLGLGLSVGLFFPGHGSFGATEQDPEFRGRAEISFSF
jgi:hypothetical protein